MMTLLADQQLLLDPHELLGPGQQLRQGFANLTIGSSNGTGSGSGSSTSGISRARSPHFRVEKAKAKPSPTNNSINAHGNANTPAATAKANAATASALRRCRQRMQPRRESLQLPAEHHDCARHVFKVLPTLPHLLSRTPRLRLRTVDNSNDSHGNHNNGGNSLLGLEYPQHKLWKLAGDPTLPELSREDIRQLRKAVVGDICQLYELRVAYVPDTGTMSVARKLFRGGKAEPVPFVDEFDFSKHADDKTIQWSELRDRRVAMIEAEFDVLELLAQLSESPQPQPQSHSQLQLQPPSCQPNLQPSTVAKVLRQHKPPEKRSNAVIRQVPTYSPELSDFLIDAAGTYLRTLAPRAGEALPWIRELTQDYGVTIEHVLGLLEQSTQAGRHEDSEFLARRRAALLVLHAALLIQLHASNVQVLGSRQIVGMHSHGGTVYIYDSDSASAYTSREGFRAVAEARGRAGEAVYQLWCLAGVEIDEKIAHFVRFVA
ncbi:hypothetical protein F4777DRAFT_164995 [Nemania sp. FL0916]|nr:hypothetical protein F4777DRAFT_164995 [Nemania sp. FL0916]